MKKILTLILVICSILSICACSKKETGSEYSTLEQETVALSFVTADTVQLYYAQTDNDISHVNSICIGDGKAAGIEADTVEVVDNSVPKEKVVEINGNDIKVRYQTTERMSTDKEDVFNQSFDFYKEGNDEITYLHNSNQITEYYRVGRSASSNTVLTETEIKELSEKYIAQFLPAEELSKYTFGSVTYDGEILELWKVVYKRQLYGYDTDSFVRLWFEHDGSLKVYQVWELGTYDQINKNITKEHIDVAITVAETKIKELNLNNLVIKENRLRTNTSGELFVEITYEYIDQTGFDRAGLIYAKVG